MSKELTSSDIEKRIIEAARAFTEYYSKRGPHLLGNGQASKTYMEMRALFDYLHYNPDESAEKGERKG